MRWIITIYTIIILVLVIKGISKDHLLDKLSDDLEAANKQLDASRDIIANLTQANDNLKYERDFYLAGYKEVRKI